MTTVIFAVGKPVFGALFAISASIAANGFSPHL
jgi:hypothetical protein